MRSIVWWTAGALVVLVACGKSESRAPTRAGDAGDGPASGASAGSAASGGVSGLPGRGGGTGLGGGSPPGGNAGRGGLPGGAGAANAGAGTTSGSAGSSSAGVATGAGGADSGAGGNDPGGAGMGAAGAPAEACGDYVACGCGCCPGLEPSSTTCYYPDRGETLDAIMSADQAAASDASCASAGCSIGLRRVCCETSSADDGAGTYTGTGYSGGLNHLSVQRVSPAGRCTTLEIAEPASGERPFALDLPQGWMVQIVSDGPCDPDGMVSEPVRFALGGVGTMSFQDDPCTLTVDATLFFLSESGEVDAVRLKQAALPVTGALACR